MNWIDPTIILIYVLTMVVIGFWCAKQSSKGMRSYFLGGNKVPWWVLSASGSASNYDVTGTMFLVSVFYVMGLRSLYLWWSWQFFASAFLMAYMALWVYRTRAMTAVELLHARFGSRQGGRFARISGAVLMVTFLLFMLGYAFVGISKFLPIIVGDDLCLKVATLIPQGLISEGGLFWFTINGVTDPEAMARMVAIAAAGKVLAAALMIMTTVYVTVGGFKGVVLTDLIQACLMSLGGLMIAYLAFTKLSTTPGALAALKENFTTGILPVKTIGAADYGWHEFAKFMPYWIIMGFLINMNGAGGHYQEQRFLAARSERDVAKVGLGWGLFLLPRWLMIAGITFIAITGLVDVTDPEQILPIVIRDMFPVGVRGIILAALAAAFMSTLSSVLNAASGMVVRDIVQPLKPEMEDKHLIRIGYGVTVACLLCGFVIGSQADSIRGIWSWIMAGLIGGMLIPNILRWHWWRLNGVGYATGLFAALTVAGVTGLCSFLYGLVDPGDAAKAAANVEKYSDWLIGLAQSIPSWLVLNEYISAPIIWGASLLGSVLGSMLSTPTEMKTLQKFFINVRPFGFWGPVKAGLSPADLPEQFGPTQSIGRIVLNVILGLGLMVGLYYGGFLCVGHLWLQALPYLVMASVCGIALVFTWYRKVLELPDTPMVEIDDAAAPDDR